MFRRIVKASLVVGVLAGIGFVATIPVVCCAAREGQAGEISVEGQVVDAKGTAIVSATVTLLRDGVIVRVVRTGSDGKFAIAGVAPGGYELRVERAGLTTVVRSVTVTRDATSLRVPVVTLIAGAAGGDSTYRLGGGGRGGGGALPGPAAQEAVGDRAIAMPRTAPEPPPSYQRSLGNQTATMAQGLLYPGDVIAPTGRRGEGYAHVASNRFRRTTDEPLSTFGADVDTASFANVRRFLRTGQLPPTDAVRVEELINYFRFPYDRPQGGHSIGITTEVADAPWNPRHKLVLVGARAETPSAREITGRNIVLLVDVSGSMSSDDKLPLIKSALGLFVDTLKPTDRLSLVTYAGSSGVALPPTPARDRGRILSAIQGLGAGGSTNGAGGISTAYRLARESFIDGGVNRVILATDGDFNVGVTSSDGLLQLIEREKESGVFLSVLGVGTGNLQDATMEMLADKGNGHYSYLDSLQEARRVLVREVGSTLETVAKDVKFQIEFNPAEVAAWKLIGYENRLLAHEDFNDDRKDGGEVGAGHTVTVLYEVVPVGVAVDNPSDEPDGRPLVDPLRYPSGREGRPPAPAPPAARRGEWLTVKVRYQQPDGHTSRLITEPVSTQVTARPLNLPFAAAVAEYGLLLREPRSGSSKRWDGLIERLESMTVPATLRSDRDHVTELAVLARDLTRLR